MVSPASLHELLETSDVVGNIRFSHPTLYVFPGGQGDAALFGINGFNMLGEFRKKNQYKFHSPQTFTSLARRKTFFRVHFTQLNTQRENEGFFREILQTKSPLNQAIYQIERFSLENFKRFSKLRTGILINWCFYISRPPHKHSLPDLPT